MDYRRGEIPKKEKFRENLGTFLFNRDNKNLKKLT